MSNEEQFDYWNGEAGQRWAREDATMARLLRPVCEALIAHADVTACRRALDVGCGGGSQSLLLAEAMGQDAEVLGVDISAPMLAVAEAKLTALPERAASLQFQRGDAAEMEFESEAFDLLFSRFGVMFFDQPQAAFANLHGAMASGAKLAFCCWQPPRDNAWVYLGLKAALQHVSPLENVDPEAPGPFAFADPERVRGILSGAGFSDVEFYSYEPLLRFSQTESLDESVRELASIGPLSRLLADEPGAVLEKVYAAMKDVLAPYYSDGALELGASIWFVSARA